jgi:hypothetical protein
MTRTKRRRVLREFECISNARIAGELVLEDFDDAKRSYYSEIPEEVALSTFESIEFDILNKSIKSARAEYNEPKAQSGLNVLHLANYSGLSLYLSERGARSAG